jgi:hypothetical protein
MICIRRLREKLLREEEVEESKFEIGEEEKTSNQGGEISSSRRHEESSKLTDWELKMARQDAEAEARRLRIEKVKEKKGRKKKD